MERRYLAATLALAATFAIFSGEFCTRYLSKVPHSTAQLKAEIACAKQYVAKQLLAKLESYTGQRAAEQQPMLAELNVPEVPEALAEPVAVVPPVAPTCPAKPLVRKAPQHVIQMRVIADDSGHTLIDRSIVRAELLSQRGQAWQLLANQRMIERNVKALAHAQKISARAMEEAQRQIEKSHLNIVIPPTTSKAIHINFVAPSAVAPAEPSTPAVY